MKIKEYILNELKNYNILEINYEGSNVIIYTNDLDLFLNTEIIKPLSQKIKKRIFVRYNPKLLLSKELAYEKIKEILKDYGLKRIHFDENRGIVFIELLHPEKITDQEIKRIKLETKWFPIFKRYPLIESEITLKIRDIWYYSSEFRKKFLDKLGDKIYREWKKDRNYFVRLSFLGAAREVGRSAILLQTKDSNILLDCGVNVAFYDERALPRFDVPEFIISNLDAIIISHAHLDHIGAIPLLIKYGYDGPIYMTEPTLDLAVTLLLDYIDVMIKSGKTPFFTSKEVKEMIKRTIVLKYMQVTDISPDVRLTFYQAGHVLGSALVHLNVGRGSHNILYTGDFKFGKTKLHDPAHYTFERVETLIMESTYSGNNDRFPPREKIYEEFINLINKIIQRNGKIVIPVLGLGRAQEVLVLLDEAWRNNKLPEDIEVYVEGMIWDINSIYTTYYEYLSKEMRKKFEEYNPFKSEIFHRIKGEKDREKVLENDNPYIVLATSGMMTGGPVIEYFRHLAIDKRNALIFVSYQAKNTLGRYLQEKKKPGEPLEVLLELPNGKEEIVKVNMDVFTIEGLSGHSNRNELENYIKRINPKPNNVFLVHGEYNKMKEFKQYLVKNRFNTITPNLMDAYRVY